MLTSIDISSSRLLDFRNVVHTLQQTGSEGIVESAQNVTLPNIVPSILTEEGRKVRNIGSVGRDRKGSIRWMILGMVESWELTAETFRALRLNETFWAADRGERWTKSCWRFWAGIDR